MGSLISFLLNQVLINQGLAAGVTHGFYRELILPWYLHPEGISTALFPILSTLQLPIKAMCVQLTGFTKQSEVSRLEQESFSNMLVSKILNVDKEIHVLTTGN